MLRPALLRGVGRLRREVLEPALGLRLHRQDDDADRRTHTEDAERDLAEKPPPGCGQRPLLLRQRAEVRQRAHRDRSEQEHDREPRAVVDAQRMLCAVGGQARPREGPRCHADAGATSEQQYSGALHPRPSEHEPERDCDAGRQHAAARVGQQQPDDERVDVDDARGAQPVPVLTPRREPDCERQRHREQQPERVPIADRRAEPRDPARAPERRDRLPEQRPPERQRQHAGQHVRPLA
jgi:hypothetical protein